MELAQHARTGDFILSQANRTRSLENGILASGQAAALNAGTVLGQVLTAGAATPFGTPTGTGAITVGAIGKDAQPGIYKLVCVAAATNAGTFNFYAPDGSLIRQVTVAGGAAPNDHMPITIADATDFVVGDSFTIEVDAGNYTAFNPAGTNGSQIAAGILHAFADATAADVAIVAFVRDGEVKIDGLIWPAGITTPQTAAAVAQLNARGVFLR